MNILMAQVGCFVPCDKASISVRDCIFARVGAGDCQVSSAAIYFCLLKIDRNIINWFHKDLISQYLLLLSCHPVLTIEK